MKLLALAAVMMVSGTMVGQAGKAADTPVEIKAKHCGQDDGNCYVMQKIVHELGFDFNAPGPIAWKDPYYVKYASGWMCTRELVEKRDTICFRMLESFHWAVFDCTKDSQVCRDLK